MNTRPMQCAESQKSIHKIHDSLGVLLYTSFPHMTELYGVEDQALMAWSFV
jgi:hypothetical protein